MSLASRIGQLERVIGTDDEPRRIIIYHGPHYREPWIERHGDIVSFHVPADPEAPVMDYLTDEMRRMIRPGDQVVTFETGDDGRNPHLQHDIPPSKRRPYRLAEDRRSYELELQPGVWCRYSFDEGS